MFSFTSSATPSIPSVKRLNNPSPASAGPHSINFIKIRAPAKTPIATDIKPAPIVIVIKSSIDFPIFLAICMNPIVNIENDTIPIKADGHSTN